MPDPHEGEYGRRDHNLVKAAEGGIALLFLGGAALGVREFQRHHRAKSAEPLDMGAISLDEMSQMSGDGFAIGIGMPQIPENYTHKETLLKPGVVYSIL